MSILNHAKTVASNKLKPVKCNLRSLKLQDEIYSGDSFQAKRKYILSAEVFTEFWATDAEKDRVEQIAMKVLNQAIYEGSLSCIAKMRMAVLNDDNEELLKLIDELESEIGL